MCLAVKNNTKIETAKEDIICYKVFKIVYHSGGFMFLSYYRGVQYSFNVLYTLENSSLEIDSTESGLVVEEGFHSFVSQASAQRFLNENNGYFGSPSAIIFKCKIPKGAKFVRGIFSASEWSSYKSICSDQIIVLESV